MCSRSAQAGSDPGSQFTHQELFNCEYMQLQAMRTVRTSEMGPHVLIRSQAAAGNQRAASRSIGAASSCPRLWLAGAPKSDRVPGHVQIAETLSRRHESDDAAVETATVAPYVRRDQERSEASCKRTSQVTTRSPAHCESTGGPAPSARTRLERTPSMCP